MPHRPFRPACARLVRSVVPALLLATLSSSAAADVPLIRLAGEAKLLAPEPTRPMRGRRFDEKNPEITKFGFSWAAVEGASKYLFQVDEESTFHAPLNSSAQVVSATSCQVVGFEKGGYFWRVAALDGFGNVGPWSPVSRFSINTGLPGSGDDEPPKLEIADHTQIGHSIIITGSVETDGRLEAYVNGTHVDDVSVMDDGDFSITVDAEKVGDNTVRLVALKRSGATTYREVTFHFEGY